MTPPGLTSREANAALRARRIAAGGGAPWRRGRLAAAWDACDEAMRKIMAVLAGVALGLLIVVGGLVLLALLLPWLIVRPLIRWIGRRRR